MDKKIIRKEWALVTGASSGIGKAFAERLAEYGYNLVLIATDEEKLNILKDVLLKQNKINVKIITADLNDKNSFKLIEEKIQNIDIDVLVNNAGFGLAGEFLDNQLSEYIKMIDVNCAAPLYLTKIIADKMKFKKSGAIIFIGSTLSFIPTPFNSVYSASKAFIESFACSLWYELKKYNIDVLSVNPGTTKTEFHFRAGLKQNNIFRYPEQVVDTAFKYIGKKPSVIDGFINKIIILTMSILTRKQIVKISGNIFNKFINNHEK